MLIGLKKVTLASKNIQSWQLTQIKSEVNQSINFIPEKTQLVFISLPTHFLDNAVS